MGVRRICLDPDDDALPYIPVVTIKPKFKGRMVITCTEPFECCTHFIGGRTLPCLEPECGACDAERPKRYEAFVSGVWVRDKKHEIIRLTTNAMYQLKDRMRGVVDYRGTLLEVERRGERKNGRVVVTVADGFVESARLPERPDLEQHLLKIWRIDGIRVSDDERAYIIALQRHMEETISKGGKSDAS